MQKALLSVFATAAVVGTAVMWWVVRSPMPAVDPAAAERGAAYFQVCSACHGENAEGNPATFAPKLAGQHGWYLEQQLRNFRAGVRGADTTDLNGMVMAPMAAGLPDDQAVVDVVAYIGTLKP